MDRIKKYIKHTIPPKIYSDEVCKEERSIISLFNLQIPNTYAFQKRTIYMWGLYISYYLLYNEAAQKGIAVR